MDIKEIREEYESLFGKKAFGGWDSEKLQELIAEKKASPGDQVVETKSTTKKEKVEKVKDPVLDFEIDQEKVYEFVLQKRTQAKHNIPTTARVWDEATNTIRDIRYCRTEESPYVDEQSEDARVERELIRFSSKTLSIQGTEKAKIRYLLAYDANGDKEKILHNNAPIKNLYRLKDTSAEDQAEIEFRKLRLKAGRIVEEADIQELKNFMRSRFGETSEDENIVLKEAFKKADAAPAVFTTDFTNPKHKIKAQIQKALEQNIIIVDGNEVKYNKSGAVVKNFDKARYEYDEALARWVLTGDKDSKEFLSVLEDKLK